MVGKGRKQETETEEVSESMKRFLDFIDSFRYKAKGPTRNRKKPLSLPFKRTAPLPPPKRKRATNATNKVKPPKRKAPRSTLTPAEMTWEAYRRLPPGFTFHPPRSSHCLLQEDHAFDPWRVLVICLLLNRTCGVQVKRVIGDFFALCPDAHTTKDVDPDQIKLLISCLGLGNARTELIKKLSFSYLEDGWTFVSQLPGVGKYAADAYAIFCSGWGAQVKPEDHKLVGYWNEIYGEAVAALPEFDSLPERIDCFSD